MDKIRMKQLDGIGYLGPDDCWKALGICIVRQAILDWNEAVKRSAEHFLSSSACEFYSGLDGPTLLRKLKAGDF